MHGTRKPRISSIVPGPHVDFVQCQVLARTLVGWPAPSARARRYLRWRLPAVWPIGRLVFNSVRIRRVLSRHTFARSFKGIEFRFSVDPNTILAKFACSFTHFATAASASRNQEGEVLLSSSQPCLSASESSCSNLALRARSLSISASLPATCSRYAWSMASEMESASSWTADKTE